MLVVDTFPPDFCHELHRLIGVLNSETVGATCKHRPPENYIHILCIYVSIRFKVHSLDI